MRVAVITPPAPVITPQEAAEHLKVDDFAEEGGIIEAMVAAATAHIDGPDGWLGRAIGVQTLEAYLPAFGVTSIGLPYPPAVDIVSCDYIDSSGNAAEVAADDYELRGQLLRPAWSKAWPAAQWRGCDGEPVRIRYRAGYETVPAPIRAAILLMVGDLYRNRSTVSHGREQPNAVPMSTTVENLLGPYRIYG